MQGTIQIINSSTADVAEILSLYNIAIHYQKIKGAVPWAGLTKELIEKEITEKRQWKLLLDGKIACIWLTAFSDPLIWEERNADASVYIHRIATYPDFRGKNMVATIVDWAKTHAEKNNKTFIRLDTVGKNPKLITHYQACGFTFLGLKKLRNTAGLPQHYNNAPVCLFELSLLLK